VVVLDVVVLLVFVVDFFFKRERDGLKVDQERALCFVGRPVEGRTHNAAPLAFGANESQEPTTME